MTIEQLYELAKKWGNVDYEIVIRTQDGIVRKPTLPTYFDIKNKKVELWCEPTEIVR